MYCVNRLNYNTKYHQKAYTHMDARKRKPLHYIRWSRISLEFRLSIAISKYPVNLQMFAVNSFACWPQNVPHLNIVEPNRSIAPAWTSAHRIPRRHVTYILHRPRPSYILYVYLNFIVEDLLEKAYWYGNGFSIYKVESTQQQPNHTWVHT